ncbi:putative L-lactate permease [Flavobacteriaceae bacterium UJ101]|nr:putative L-lactate permease [Flavobacteriaceae bacterium UJ101]
MNVQILFSFFPILLLIWLMAKKNGMPSNKALPLSAFVVYLITLCVFQYDANRIHANVILGLLEAWKPILIIAGAIFLFKTMEITGCISVVKNWLNSISENQVAQLMIVGWAFPFLIEGASGFGTPAAIAAPILVGLGYPPIKVALTTLMMNTVPVSFGAVGTPTWYGFSALPELSKLSEYETLSIGYKSALIHSFIAFFIVFIALAQILNTKIILKNIGFVIMSIVCTVVPYLLVSTFNYEFPSLIGGSVGLLCSIFLAQKHFGLEKNTLSKKEKKDSISTRQLIKATFPLWGTIILLIITRIPQLGIKSLLRLKEPSISLDLGYLGELSLSTSLVAQLQNILNTSEKWIHEILYIPSLIPFVLISFITFWLYKTNLHHINSTIKQTTKQMINPTLALLGALVFVSLMMMGGEKSAVNTIGSSLANITGDNWTFFGPYLGAIGSFFSGSATISNLTFSGIQNSIALETGLDRTTILALQSVGGSFGNMICINNIVAVTSVLALSNQEGYILKRTVLPTIIYGLLAGIFAILLF